MIKIKRYSALFKKRVNIRLTFLKKRSLLFEKYLPKKNFRLRKFKKKKYTNYRVNVLDLYKKKKKMVYDNRNFLRVFFNKKTLKKQFKLSKYIINFLNKNSLQILNDLEFRLEFVLIKSHFFDNTVDSNYFIKNGFVIVNNKILTNPLYLVKSNDIIRLKKDKSYFYYIYYRNNLNNAFYMSKKLN